MKKLISVMLILVMVLGIIGCSNDTASKDGAEETKKVSETKEKENTTKESKKLELTYALWDKNLQPIYEKIAIEFEKQNPEIDIVIEITPWSDYWTKLEAAASGGVLPDIFWMNGPNITMYADANVVLPITEYVEDDQFDLSNYPQSLVDLYTVNGENYAIPIFWDTIALYYNKEIFDQAGVEYPTDSWTMEDLVQAATELTNPDTGVYGIAAPLDNQQNYYNTIHQAGGYIISDDKKTSGFDDPATIKGIQVWVDMINQGISPTLMELNETNAASLFESGKLAMVYSGSWMYPQYAKNENLAGKFDLEVLPMMEERASVIHGLGACINPATDYPDEAWQFVKFLGSEEANDIFAMEKGGLPAYLPSVNKFIDQESSTGYNVAVFTDQVSYSAMYPNSKHTSKWQAVERDYLKQAYTGEMTVEEACKKIAEEMNGILDKE
ncbi:ABC transporter substrate-binding protein [Vallitalea okinawensis]|uniref:ABC transporter substrate-binding protein n=1 Tax=Vallitalea okinawensis TaxID=2078660 RepID=UPI000CFC8C8B|nr:sugar ABC transporter substrate-binding protein [Vallitalea okinawensis]